MLAWCLDLSSSRKSTEVWDFYLIEHTDMDIFFQAKIKLNLNFKPIFLLNRAKLISYTRWRVDELFSALKIL